MQHHFRVQHHCPRYGILAGAELVAELHGVWLLGCVGQSRVWTCEYGQPDCGGRGAESGGRGGWNGGWKSGWVYGPEGEEDGGEGEKGEGGAGEEGALV